MQNVTVVDIARRFTQNPLITPGNVKPSSKEMRVEHLLNPAVFRYDRKIWLLMRVAERPEQKDSYITVPMYNESGEIETQQFAKADPDLDFTDPWRIHHKGEDYPTTLSHLKLMCSEDGKTFYDPENYSPIFGEGELEAYGIEDCRVAEINGIYYLTYTMVSPYGLGVGLIQTRDWKRFDRKGMILPPHNRSCAVFEEKIRDRYYALHRPGSQQPEGNYIWLAESADSIHWGNHKCIATTRKNKWDSERIGAGCSPIQTPQGWLVIYHGADENDRCCLGALLLDIKDPSRVIARSDAPFMEPSESYELDGVPGNMLFTNGHLVIGNKLYVYYSASNKVICGAEVSIQEVLGSLSVIKS